MDFIQLRLSTECAPPLFLPLYDFEVESSFKFSLRGAFRLILLIATTTTISVREWLKVKHSNWA